MHLELHSWILLVSDFRENTYFKENSLSEKTCPVSLKSTNQLSEYRIPKYGEYVRQCVMERAR